MIVMVDWAWWSRWRWTRDRERWYKSWIASLTSTAKSNSFLIPSFFCEKQRKFQGIPRNWRNSMEIEGIEGFYSLFNILFLSALFNNSNSSSRSSSSSQQLSLSWKALLTTGSWLSFHPFHHNLIAIWALLSEKRKKKKVVTKNGCKGY